MKRSNLPVFLAFVTCTAAFLPAACAAGAGTPSSAYYLAGPPETRQVFGHLFALLEAEPAGTEERFAVARELAAEYTRLKDYGRLINFLGAQIVRYPDDPYNAWYMLMIAYGHIRRAEDESHPVAALYFDLILKNYPDLLVAGESVHLACLNHLIASTDEPAQAAHYLEELIARFPDKINRGLAYFMLARNYELSGEWNGAIRAYTQYLPYRGTAIPGYPEADKHAKQLVDFNNSPKDWTFDSLPSLVAAVKGALTAGSAYQMERYRAKVNFFVRTWQEEEDDGAGVAAFTLSSFMRGNHISYTEGVDAGSNANEAYMRTWGWAHISTWYLYFRKIYFPQDPEIHGRWEWAGVYYGEKL